MNAGVRVLLVSPGCQGRLDGDFGDPHLVALGSYLQARAGAQVEVIDLEYERHLASGDPGRVFSRDFAVVGISCYSSLDYLSAFYLGCEIRRQNPGAILVTGGYHPSARPGDFLSLPGSELEEPSPFDHVVVGDGELPLARIVAAAGRGERPSEKVLGPEPLADLDDLPPLDWSLLDRYRPIARTLGGQVTISFSRGCPFGCSFCMERSKGESTWRAWSPGRAEQELQALDRWLGLAGWNLFIADALFGFDPEWRREMLQRLARLDLGLDKIWTLSRIDLMGPGDAELYHRAGFGVGFGLESGDPEMLRRMGKTAVPESFLGRFLDFARQAARIGLPWGANLLVGHPGETAGSLESSARFVARLFLETGNLTGFLSVDPFRFYPGSLIDRRLPWYVEQYGTRVHRPRWWNYSEQAFTSEWVDPSAGLDYRQTQTLAARWLEPIVRGIAERFAYRGPARDYFQRSVDHALDAFRPPYRLGMLADYHLWRGLTGQGRSRLVDDPEARDLFRRARQEELAQIGPRLEGPPPPTILAAMIDEPRERYVPDDEVLNSWQDAAVLLTEEGNATLSALHAYLVNFTLLDLCPGDRLIEVGGGTGYGAALAARLVGDEGRVVSYEIVPALAALATQNLAGRTNVSLLCCDGLAPAELPPFNKALFTCALGRVPRHYLDALPENGRLLAPLFADPARTDQVLTLYTRTKGRLDISRHGPVHYVAAKEGMGRAQ